MNSRFYLPRKLHTDEKNYSEVDALDTALYVVVLAEPGAGKTRLLESLATQLNTQKYSATTFLHRAINDHSIPLVIDGFDELAKIDSSGIYKLLGKVSELQPTKVIISSRSSEWDESYTLAFADFFGIKPNILRIFAFDQDEQQKLFEDYLPDENFERFRTQVSQFNLEPLLPNPQFLKLFADAYIESNRNFINKKSIFSLAIDRLAKESNPSISSRDDLSYTQKVALTEEVFAKLLLSGAEGITLTDVGSNRIFPSLKMLLSHEPKLESLLASKLFLLGDKENQHYPVHKIVMEYCAANYLIKRLTAETSFLSLSQCLAIIAPNSVVRDELRGLLGWMAALGNKPIQEALIDLDPYAVLANGDPSQLLPISKKRLLHNLKKVAEENPHFQRSDKWRTFSVAGFFKEDFIEGLKPILLEKENYNSLLSLILILLENSQVIPFIVNELQQLVLLEGIDKYIRVLANQRLLEFNGYNYRFILDTLIAQSTSGSLSIAGFIFEKVGENDFENSYIANFLRCCARLYPTHNTRWDRVIGERYFIKSFIGRLDLKIIEWLLHDLTKDLGCICSKEDYECECRGGISKIVGSLLDRYFELTIPPYDPLKIWQWIQNLNFHSGKSEEDSLSVRALQESDVLRQSIIELAFENITEPELINKICDQFYSSHTHSGLRFKYQDYFFIVDLAFKQSNAELWSNFIQIHQYYNNKKQENPLRRHMRLQAQENPIFLLRWVTRNLANRKNFIERKNRFSFSKRRAKKRKHHKEIIRKKNVKYVHDNRELVESGQHWQCLVDFANLVLFSPEDIEKEFGEEQLVRNALRNCLNFIESHVPNLQELASLQCESKYNFSEVILYAACIEIYRTKGTLVEVKTNLLQALRTNLDVYYNGVTNEEHKALIDEVDQLLFPTIADAENFLRNYIEPQLRIRGCQNPQVNWLRHDEVFKPLQASLSLEWLSQYPEIPLNAITNLFDSVAQFGDKQELEKLIISRCEEFIKLWGKNATYKDDWKNRGEFWFMRAFFFLPDKYIEKYWNCLKADKETIFLLIHKNESLRHGDEPYWPTLSAKKVYYILDAFIDKWPKVELHSPWGTESPAYERAYRFLTEIIWIIEKNASDESIKIVNQLLEDARFKGFQLDLKSIRASIIKKLALKNFEAPEPQKIVNFLDRNGIPTVEGLRALLLDELQLYQKDLNGSETTTKDIFYNIQEDKSRVHLGEVEATLRIADRLRLRLESKGITVIPEYQMKDANRCDITCSKLINNQRKLLVIEAKGQWHKELYNAASEQLSKKYSIHPHAEQQGIYLVLWFSKNEKVANRINKTIKNAQQLKESIELTIPTELKGLIDVFVLDVSRY